MHRTKNIYRHFVKKIPKGTPAKHKQQNFREENMRIQKKFLMVFRQ